MRSSVWTVLMRIFWTLVVVALIAVATLLYMNRQTFQDHFAAQDFDPSPRISEVTSSLALTDVGERIFFATHPSIEGRETFNTRCERSDHDSGGHLLGCYSDDRIHLFEVDDDRLTGVVEVTAAHELLHAAHARLSQSERERLSKRLRDVYEELIVADPTLEERMSVYSSLSAARFANELHSVLGTEVADLPDWLENHYATWFADRASIVELFDSYHEVFASLQRQAESLQERLESLRAGIEDESSQYTASVEQFNADWASFRARNDAFEFSDEPDEFYRLLDAFEQRRTVLEDWRVSLEERVEEHERLRLELEELGELSSELNEKIDSEFSPPIDTTD